MNFSNSIFKILAYVLFSIFNVIDADITYEAQFISNQSVYLFSRWENAFHFGIFSFTILVLSILLIPLLAEGVLMVFEPVNQVVEAV